MVWRHRDFLHLDVSSKYRAKDNSKKISIDEAAWNALKQPYWKNHI